MADQTTIEKAVDDITAGVKAVQEKMDSLEKKYDGLDVQVSKDVADVTAKNLEDLQKLKQEIKADEMLERMKALEAEIVKGNAGIGAEITPAHEQEFYKYLRKGVHVPVEVVQVYCEGVAQKSFIHADESKIAAYTKDLVEGSNPAGGYFITPERSTQIMKRVFETSPMRSIANTVTTSSDSIEMIIDDDEVDCGWVGETESRAGTTTPEIGLLTIPVHELYAKPKASQRLLDDVGFDVEGWLQGKTTAKFSRTENTSFVTGNGSKKAKGFLAYAAWGAAGVYQRDALEQLVSTGTAGTVDEADDFITLQNMLIEEYQASAVFAMTRSSMADVMKLKDSQGRYLLDPHIFKDGTDKILLNKPVVIMADMPEVVANSLSVAYGDFGEGYTIVDRFGIRVLRDPYSAKPNVEFYSTKRVGGAVTNFESIKIMKTKA